MTAISDRIKNVAAVLHTIEDVSQIRTSKFVNLISKAEKKKYADECWDLLQTAYKSIGGFHSANDPEQLINDSFLWKLNVKGGNVVALSVYKERYGRKAIAVATDGTAVGKTALMEIFKEDLTRAWVECSGSVEKVLMRMGGSAYIVPAKYAEQLTGKEVVISEDGLHYTRTIGGHSHEKIIIGTPTGITIERP